METIFEQMTLLLVNPPGNMIYHLVLVFAVTAAIQGVLISRRANQGEYLGRALFGLGLALAAQVVIFLSSGLAWQGLANPHIFLPPLDRLVTLFSLLWIGWLWAFPRPSRLADALAGLGTLVLVIAFLFTLNQWSIQPPPHIFNGSIYGWPWEVGALIVLMSALFALVLRRPDGWGIGLGFVLLNLFGHVIEFLWPTSGDFSGIVRLAQLCSFPLLPVLAQRLISPAQAAPVRPAVQFKVTPLAPKHENPAKSSVMVERRRFSADPRTVHSWLNVALEDDPARLQSALTRAVAQTMLADICFFLAEPGPNGSGSVLFRGGYDLIREEDIPAIAIDRDKLPSIATSLQRGKPYRLEAGSSTPDLKTLGERFGLGPLGGMLLIPLANGQHNLGGFLLLSPYSNRSWTLDDQNYFTTAIEPMLQVLQRKAAAGIAPAAPAVDLAEVESLRKQLAEERERSQQTAQPDFLSLMAVQKESHETIASLLAENERLKQSTHKQEAAAGGLSQADLAYLESELRQALKESARLQNQLAEANIELLIAQKQAEQPVRIINDEREVVASIAQELRQPMASIIGYTELLLSESAGILGALQRKFLERVKASIERMRSILDDLVQVTSLQNGKIQLVAQPIQASAAIDQAVSETRGQLQEKNINLQVDLPEELPELHADRDAVQQILVHLLQNASAATPAEGTISLKVRVDNQTANEPFLLFQITDTGGGIAPSDLPRVFSRRYRADNPLIQGVGDTGVGLSIAKTLTEAHGGRIWVNSEPGKTTTFSVLLPIHEKLDPQTVDSLA